jgi:methionine sulfoxide reductase heme-binding subunit
VKSCLTCSGVATWRWLHRFTLAVYALALTHAIGAGTDGRSGWMIAMLTVLTAPVVFGLAYRLLAAPPRGRSTAGGGGAAPTPARPIAVER